MIRLEHFSCYYKVKEGHLVAVDDVTLDVPAGQFLVLMGDSGCGKSTLLRSVLGLNPYTEGKLLVDGQDAEDYDKRKNTVAYVSQEYTLYPHLTVYENMAYPLRTARMKQEELDRRVREMAQLVGLSQLLTRLPKQLSGGQQQRLAIGRALVKQPQIVLYDEPFSNVDAQLRQQLQQLVHQISKQLHQTVIYVTHNEAEAAQLADRVVYMQEGKIVDSIESSREAPQPYKKKNTWRLFAQKQAVGDYIEAMLPQNRRQLFLDVVKLQKWSLVKLGLLMLLFSLPIHLLALQESVWVAQMHASGQASAEQITALTVTVQNLRALINIPLLLLSGLGFSGIAHVIRQYAWGEPVFLRYEFCKGIRQNCRPMLGLFLGAGIVQCISVLCSNLSFTAGELSSYAVYLPGAAALFLALPVGMYMIMAIPLYSNSFMQNLRLAVALYLKEPLKTLAAVGCVCLALLLFSVPVFYCNLIARILITVAVPILLLAWFLLGYDMLDRHINPRFFPELVGKGLSYK